MHSFLKFLSIRIYHRILTIDSVLEWRLCCLSILHIKARVSANPHSPIPSLSTPYFPATSLDLCICDSVSKICSFIIYQHISDIIGICLFLTSLSMIISSCIHFAVNGIRLFFLMAELCCVVYMDPSFFIRLVCWWTFRLSRMSWLLSIVLLRNTEVRGFFELQFYAQKWDCWIIW